MKSILMFITILTMILSISGCSKDDVDKECLITLSGEFVRKTQKGTNFVFPNYRSKFVQFLDSQTGTTYNQGDSILITKDSDFAQLDFDQYYIAHGGGMISGMKSSNCLEAIEESIKNGIKYIELDFVMTSDQILVCAHDWETFNQRTTGNDSESPISYNEFKQRKLMNKYTPLTYEMVDSIWSANPDLYLVTDKISNPAILEKFLPNLKGRMLVETFSDDDYLYISNNGYKLAMHSGYNNSQNYEYLVISSEIYEYQNAYYYINPDVKFAMYNSKININKNYANFWFDYDSNIKFFYIDDTD